MDLTWVLLAGCAWGQIVSTPPATGLPVPPPPEGVNQPVGFLVVSTGPGVSQSTGPALSTGPLQGGVTAFPVPFQFDPALQPRSVPAGYNQPGAPFSAPLPSFTPAAGASFGNPAPGAPQGPPAQPAAPAQPAPTFQQPPPAFQQPAAPTQPGASP